MIASGLPRSFLITVGEVLAVAALCETAQPLAAHPQESISREGRGDNSRRVYEERESASAGQEDVSRQEG
jgi:hypothetical protein